MDSFVRNEYLKKKSKIKTTVIHSDDETDHNMHISNLKRIKEAKAIRNEVSIDF